MLKLFFTLVLILFVGPLASDSAFKTEDTHSKPGLCTSVFESSIIKEYTSQFFGFARAELNKYPHLKDYLLLSKSKTSFHTEALSFIHFIQSKPVSDPVHYQEFHKNTLYKIRALLQQKKSLEPIKDQTIQEFYQLIDALCEWMYTRPHLISQTETLFQRLIPHDSMPFSLIDKITLTRQLMAENPTLIGYDKVKGQTADLHLNGYLPFISYEIGNTRFLYMGRPTIDSGSKEHLKAAVSPEFIAYVTHLALTNRTHLYINLMLRTNGEKTSKNEAPLTKAIEQLETMPAIRKGIAVVSLDKNSSFYWQQGVYENKNDAKAFKKLFLEKLADSSANSLYHWPHQIDKKRWKLTCEQILTRIHSTYFGDQEVLSVKERQVFIEIAYLDIILALQHAIKPQFANITCKSNVDRGPSTHALLFAYQAYTKQGKLTQYEKERVLTHLFAPALINKNRESKASRLDRFMDTLEYIENHQIKEM